MTLGTVVFQDSQLGEFRLVNHPSGMVWLLEGIFFRQFAGHADCDKCMSPFADGMHFPCRQHDRVHCTCVISR